MSRLTPRLALLGALAAATVLGACDRPPPRVVQRGYRGLGMVQVINPRSEAEKLAENRLPEVVPSVPPAGTPSSEAYENVQVLGDVDSDEFTRLMVAITNWVSPQQGCNYCHSADGNFASDAVYTKIVSRRMIQMTRHVNAEWKAHVGNTGVTCYTCHRGQPVPANYWYNAPPPPHPEGVVGNRAGQNAPAPTVAMASLPNDPFTPFLEQSREIRVIGNDALEGNNRRSIKQAEWTYGLMMHFSQSLGVNCTYCHNSRSFFAWDQSTPARANAWYGIRMVRDLNGQYLEPLGPHYPESRLGPHGDAPKANCATCHNGVFKPLYGVSMLQDYPELAAPGAQPKSASAEP